MKKIKKRWLILMTVAILLVSSFAMPKQQVFCDLSGSARFGGTDVTLNIGDTYTIGWAVTASENVLMEVAFSVSSGISILSTVCAQNGYTGKTRVIEDSGKYTAFHGGVTIRADTPGQFTVRISEVSLQAERSSEIKFQIPQNYLPSFTVYVRTKEQTDASIAEQERIRREQAERASREQAEAASRAASISASASEEERRRKEKEDAEYREWLSRSEIEASESAKAASISASESEVEASISASESEAEAFRMASESEVERTRPTEFGKLEYVRYTYGPDEDEDSQGDEVFYLVTPEGELLWPEDTSPIAMRINDVHVLALRTDGMSSNTYLVYGMKDETDVPAWYYWHRSTNTFFRYDYLHNNVPYAEPSTENLTENPEAASSTTAPRSTAPLTTEPGTGTTLPPKDADRKPSVKDVLTLVLSGALGGAALTALIFLLVLKGRRKAEENGKPEETHREAEAAASQEAPKAPKEKTGDTDAVDLD